MLVNIKVYYFSVFGKGTIPLILNDDATVGDALNELNKRFGDAFVEKTGKKLMEAFEDYFNVFLNGTRLKLPLEIRRKLRDKDELVILRPVGGGRSLWEKEEAL